MSESLNTEALLQLRLDRLEGKQEDLLWFISKASAMPAVNEKITELKKESFRGLDKLPVFIAAPKENLPSVVARRVHKGSAHAKGPWIASFHHQLLNNNAESVFYGGGALPHSIGLLQLAQGGTLFLENAHLLTSELQNRLAQTIQSKNLVTPLGEYPLNVQCIFSAPAVKLLTKELQNVFYSFVIEIPSLQALQSHIVSFSLEYAQKHCQLNGKQFEGFEPQMIEWMETYDWPKSFAELISFLDLALCKYDKGLLKLPFPSTQSQSSTILLPQGNDLNYTAIKKQWSNAFEKEYLLKILEKYHGNVSAAARASKLDRSNFLRLLRRHGLKAEPFRYKTAA